MRVLITGSSGCLAATLVPALCDDLAIERVTGIDLRPAKFTHAKFQAHRIDIAAPFNPNLLHGHDALVHMACVVLRGRMTEVAMHEINVAASLNLLRLAAECGIGRLIALSSAAVYGSGIDLSEDTPLLPLAGFCYGQHKAELERQIEAELPHCLRLRPHVILGEHAQPLLRFVLGQPCYPRLSAPEPQIQCVHERDVVAAIRLALRSPLSGALNLAAEGKFSFGEAIRQRRRTTFPVSPKFAQALLNCSWGLTGFGGEPGWMQGLLRPLTLNCLRAQRELGWMPQHSANDALNAA